MPKYDAKQDIERLSRELIHLRETLKEECTTAAKLAALQETQRNQDTLDDRIQKRIKVSVSLVGVVVVLLGALGYFGIRWNLAQVLEDEFSVAAKAEMDSTLLSLKTYRDEALAAREAILRDPLIVLQTDYGSDSPYMGTLMGVIYRINPHARIQTITSEIADFDILDAAWTLWRASRFYPAGTIFVVITNPGGLTSKPAVVLTKNGHMYIGHDNGCFDLVVEHYGHVASYTIASPKLTPTETADLFGGVDQFGPAAGELSRGFPLEQVGPKSAEYKQKLRGIRYYVRDSAIHGAVMDVDKFGNLTTNIPQEVMEHESMPIGEQVMVSLNDFELDMPVVKTYGHVSAGAPVAIYYEGLLQLAINQGNFAEAYKITRKTPVIVRRRQ